MTKLPYDRQKDGIYLTVGILVLLALGILLMIGIALIFAEDAGSQEAQWLTVHDFGGVVTVQAPAEMGINVARSSTGWYNDKGDLRRININKRDTLTATATAQGVKFLAPHEGTNSILWSHGGALESYSIDADQSAAISAGVFDTCKTIADSNAVYWKGSNFTNSRWLNLVLADASPTQRFSIKIGDAYFPTRMFLGDSVVVMVSDQSASATDTITWLTPLSTPTGEPSYYFIHGDTTTIIDGENRTSYGGIEIGSIDWPVYSDSGSYDSVGTDTVQVKDSLLVYGNFDSTGSPGYGGGTSWQGAYFLWSDNTDSSRAVPFFVAAHLDDGAAYERLCLVGDTSAFLSDDGSHTIYGAHFNNASKRYLMYSHGIGSYDTTQNYYAFKVYVQRVETINTASDGTVMRRLVIPAKRPAGLATSDLPSYMFNTRALDGSIWRLREYTKSVKDVESASCRVERVFGLDSIYVLSWGRGARGLSSSVNSRNYVEFQHFPAVPWTPATAQAAFQYDICITNPHRDRAWYAKNKVVAYSDLNDWYDVAGGGTVTFQKTITALSSFGNEMVAHLDGNEIQVWTGYAEADFYKVPAAVSIAAMNQGSLAHNDVDNSDIFPHPLGLWRYTGGGVSEIETSAQDVFTDSVNWEASDQLIGAVYDNKYWFGYPQRPSTENNRLLTVNLDDHQVTFIGGINPGSFYVRTDPEVGQQLWVGDADSSVIWLFDAETNELTTTANMKSGYFTNDDRGERKLVSAYTIGYTAARGDTIMVDFFTGADDPVWSDTVVVSTGSGVTSGNTAQEVGVHTITENKPEAYGTVFSPSTSGFLDSAYVWLDWNSFDGADACTVAVALYKYNGNGQGAARIDSCYTRIFSAGEADGWKKFTFSDNTKRVAAGTNYLIFTRGTADSSEFAFRLVKDASEGTLVTLEEYGSYPISTVWAASLNPVIWTLTESTGDLSGYIFYSERVVQQHYAAVPRSVQGTALAYGLRSSDPTMRVHDFAMQWVSLGRDRMQ